MISKSYERENPEDIKVRNREEKEQKALQKASDIKQFAQFNKIKPFQKKLTNSEKKEIRKDELGPLARKAS